MAAVSLEQLISLCKRRGIIYPGSEIYGGLQGLYDYGPVGVELKNNLINSWWRTNVYERDDMEGLDSAILMNPLTWKYSGHEETFVDPLVDCRNCNARRSLRCNGHKKMGLAAGLNAPKGRLVRTRRTTRSRNHR